MERQCVQISSEQFEHSFRVHAGKHLKFENRPSTLVDVDIKLFAAKCRLGFSISPLYAVGV